MTGIGAGCGLPYEHEQHDGCDGDARASAATPPSVADAYSAGSGALRGPSQDGPPPPEPHELAWANGGDVECCSSGRCEVCAPGGFGGSRYW